MRGSRFYNGERWPSKDIAFLQSGTQGEILTRTQDLMTYGIAKATPAFHGGNNGRAVAIVVGGQMNLSINASNSSYVDVGISSIADNATPPSNIFTPTSSNLGGLAYDGNGNRVAIDASAPFVGWTAGTYPGGNIWMPNTSVANIVTAEPAMLTVTSGNVGIPIPLIQEDYFLWVEAIDATDTSTPSISTDKFGVTHYSRQVPGYRIIITDGPAYPTDALTSLPLGKVTRTSSGLVLDQEATDYPGISRKYYNFRSEEVEVLLDYVNSPTTTYQGGTIINPNIHVNAIGTGNVGINNPHGLSVADIGGLLPASLNAHRDEQHHAGIITNNRYGTSNAFYPSISGTKIVISPLVPSAEEAYSVGNRYVSSDIVPGSFTDSALNSYTTQIDPGTGDFYIDFNSVPLASDYYIIYLDAGAHITAIPSGVTPNAGAGNPVSPNYFNVLRAQIDGDLLVIASVKWISGGSPHLVSPFQDQSNPIPVPGDLREFGSISSENLEQSVPYTSGIDPAPQDPSTGFGVATPHIRNLAVTSSKLSTDTRTANNADICLSGASIVLRNTSGSIGLNMDGLYARRFGGYIRFGTNSVSSISDGSLLCANGTPSASFVSGLDAGSPVDQNWYAVFAVEDLSNTSGLGYFRLCLTTLIKCRVSGSTLTTYAHNSQSTSPSPPYGWIAHAYRGSQLLIITSTSAGDAGKILNITDSGSASLTASGATDGSQCWAMMSPAQVNLLTNVNPGRFRYLGTILRGTAYTATNAIRPFIKTGDYYQFVDPAFGFITYGAAPAGYQCLTANSGTSTVPPTAMSISGQVELIGVSTTSPVLNLSRDGSWFPIRMEGNIAVAGGAIVVPYSNLLLDPSLAAPELLVYWSGNTLAYITVTGWRE